MKLYLAMCSLSLLAGTAIGYINGTYSAASSFVDDCTATSVVVFEDKEEDTRRSFHCFELKSGKPDSAPAREIPAILQSV